MLFPYIDLSNLFEVKKSITNKISSIVNDVI